MFPAIPVRRAQKLPKALQNMMIYTANGPRTRKLRQRWRSAPAWAVRVPVSYTHLDVYKRQELKSDLSKALRDGQTEVVIIEGLLTLWDQDIYNQLDLRLFVECRADERIVRRLKRNMKRGLKFDEIADVYLDFVRYRHDEYVEPTKWRADFIINGSNFSDKAIKIIVNYVKGMVR